MKRFLYLDCDGVILNTIATSFAMMKHEGVNLEDNDQIRDFYRRVDWLNLIKVSGEINNSLCKIKELANEEIFEGINILSHVCSFEEAIIKDAWFDEAFKGLNQRIDVILLPLILNKHEMVDVSNSILVDDAIAKVLAWQEQGGIGVLFTQDNLKEKFLEPDSNRPYFVINDLSSLSLINDYLSRKTYIKE